MSQWLDGRNQPEWARFVAEAKQGFAYLRRWLDGSCNNINYDCSEMWMTLQLVKVFDPSFAAGNLTREMASDMVQLAPLRGMGADLQKNLPAYLSAAKNFVIDHADEHEFTESVLNWWANNGSKIVPSVGKAKGSPNHPLIHPQLSRSRSCLLTAEGLLRRHADASACRCHSGVANVTLHNKRQVGHAL